ncbi:hypothetical protein I3U53_21450 [Mycobacteroides abscessus subsp. abscessus]|nr:hypothetical protein [Mycobacteroides abscessus subsp. abscessus]
MPTDRLDGICAFCANYTPPTRQPEPADHLDAAVQRINAVRADLNAVIRSLPDDTGMFVIVDVVNALWNLRNAAVLLDKAGDALEAEG